LTTVIETLRNCAASIEGAVRSALKAPATTYVVEFLY
jgi:hypothetical protein